MSFISVSPAVYLELADGIITFELYTQYHQRTCENFIEAVSLNAWEGLTLRRNGLVMVSPPPTPGIGAPLVSDTPNAALTHSGAGLLTCSIADDGVWCITLAPAPMLDSHCVIIGRVASGMSVLARIASSEPIIKAMRIDDLPRRNRPSNKGLVQ